MKRFLSLLVVITIVLTGCSTKTKDEKATQVIEEKKEEKKDKTDEKKEKGEDKTDEGKIVDPITSNVSEQDKHLLNSWVIFLSSPYHYPTIEEKLDFNDPSTINTQFSYIIDYLEQSNSIQHDSDFKYAIPEELIYDAGLQLFNKEINKDSGGDFSKTYDEATNTYSFAYGGRGGANLPYFNVSEVNYTSEDQSNYKISAPYYAFNPDGLEYENVGTIVFHLQKTQNNQQSLYLVASEFVLF